MLTRCCLRATRRPIGHSSGATAMSTFRTTTDAERTITLSPENPTATVVFLHGLGDTGDGWKDAMAVLAKHLSHVKFVLPTASTMPVTLNMGMQMPAWYDKLLGTLRHSTDKRGGHCAVQYDIKSLARVDGDNADGIDQSRDRILSIIEKEVALGIPLSRIVLGGFSQGAALSMFSGYQTKTALGGVVSMSGYLPRFSSFQLCPETANVPLLMCHGEQDPVVRFEYGSLSKEKLEAAGVKDVEFHSYPDMEHSACMEELSDVTKWLQRVIPETHN